MFLTRRDRAAGGHQTRTNGHPAVEVPPGSYPDSSNGAVIASPLSEKLSSGERAAVREARARAAELLESLLADRALIEARLSSGGRVDPMKSVRGASSLEDAISTTREMIGAYDAMLGGA